MDNIYKKYLFLSSKKSDINEHLPTLYKYATECESIIECGVRKCVSSWAIAYGLLSNNKKNKKLLLNDITPCNIDEILEETADLDIVIQYKWVADIDLEIDENIDMVFIDTWHVYGLLKRELAKFGKVTNKYIIMHDTTIDAIDSESVRNKHNINQKMIESGFNEMEIRCGLWKAIEEFLEENKEWKIKERFTNNNGLTVLEKITF